MVYDSIDALTYCSESNPGSFNPQLDTSSTTADATAHQVYDRLLEFNPENGRIIPGLASSWLVSADGLTYTFQLRRGVKFHTTHYFTPNRNFNADDVIFSIDRWRSDKHPYHEIGGGVYPYFDSLGLYQKIKHVKRINGYRVEIALFAPDSSFLANLATDFAVILSAEYANLLMKDGRPSWLDKFPIGTGPYKFVNYRQNQFIRFIQNEEHFLPPSGPKQIVFDITLRSSLRMAKLITGECDAIAFPSQSDLSVIEERSDLKLLEKPGLNVGYWGFNTSKPPFDNPNVRQALALAVDKTSLIDAVYLGQAVRAKGLVPSASWAYESSGRELGYNPVRAKELLEQAGVPNNFSMDIWAMPVQRAYNPNAMKMAQLIKRYLADIGIEANIVTQDWNIFRQSLRSGIHDTVLIGWNADNGDPDNFYRPLLSCEAIPSGTNRTMWCNPEYDALVDQALLTDVVETRRQIYHQANSLIFNETPLMPIAHAFQYQATRAEISGLRINPYGGIRFENVSRTAKENLND
ncbi:ABC transporter substrate-binding protein [Agaribacter marinus]|uniref:ABC transporter substrate-binding protein n=2 Tax=Agaribacter marinus TaxID=1431249 RepID=A0AA37SY27_9ALTE|nr:ABC transporter substrate-binding protein [Agaribacter marinus]